MLCLAPMVAMALGPAHADTALVYLGLLPAFVALGTGPRVAAVTSVCTAAVVLAGLLLSTTPWAAALMMMLLGVAVTWAHTRGWQVAATYVATQAALAAVAAPRATFLRAGDHAAHTPASAAVVAGVVLLAGAWVAAVGAVLLNDLPRPPVERPARTDLVVFAIVLALALGTGTLLAMTWAPSSNVWWILLTILVVLQPDRRATWRRALERSGGTVLGGALAALAVVLVQHSAVLALLGLVAAIASAVAYVRGAYWMFAASLTVALILLTQPLGHRLRGDLERVAFTVVAALAVVVVSGVVHRLAERIRRTPAGSPT